jgi:hypothetical protein
VQQHKRDNPQMRNASQVWRGAASVRANYPNDELQQSSLTLISTLHAGVAHQKCTRLNGVERESERASEHTCWRDFKGAAQHTRRPLCALIAISLARLKCTTCSLAAPASCVCFAFFIHASLQCET